jgi:hypothetical protein
MRLIGLSQAAGFDLRVVLIVLTLIQNLIFRLASRSASATGQLAKGIRQWHFAVMDHLQ